MNVNPGLNMCYVIDDKGREIFRKNNKRVIPKYYKKALEDGLGLSISKYFGDELPRIVLHLSQLENNVAKYVLSDDESIINIFYDTNHFFDDDILRVESTLKHEVLHHIDRDYIRRSEEMLSKILVSKGLEKLLDFEIPSELSRVVRNNFSPVFKLVRFGVELRAEGLARFIENNYNFISKDVIMDFRSKLNNIGAGSISDFKDLCNNYAYGVGCHMCDVIAGWRVSKSFPILSLFENEVKKFDYSDIRKDDSFLNDGVGDFFSSSSKIRVNLSSFDIRKTVEKVKKLGYHSFIGLYDKACRELGVPEDWRVISLKEFDNLMFDLIADANLKVKEELMPQLIHERKD